MFTDGLCRQLQTIQAEKLFYQCPCQHDGLENIVQSKVGFNGRRTSFGLRARLTGSASNSGSHNYAKSSPLYKKNSPEAVENRFYFSDSTSLQRTRTVASSAKHGHCGQAFYHDEKVGVLLLNLGGPETLDDVQPFLYNLFADPDIIRLPRLFRFLQEPLARFISTLRAPKSQEGYAAIGGGSPLRKITDDQAAALGRALQMKDLHARVYVAMRYWHPFTEEALEQIKKDQITRLVILPLYPQFSISTSGSSLRLLESIFRKDEYLSQMPHTVIPSWYRRGGYVRAMSTLILNELNSFESPDEVHIFFSAHGVPVSYVEKAGDPYRTEMEECVHLIMKELKYQGVKSEHTLAYQSRVGPVEWLKPYTDEKIKELAKEGIESLLAVPISFVSEHIETLEEIDMEYRELALESGIKNWGRVPALGCEPTFIADLADAVIEALPHVGAMAASPSEHKQMRLGTINLS